MRQQHITRAKPAHKAAVEDQRQREIPSSQIDPAIANMPIRTVNFVEVGSMSREQVAILLEQLNQKHKTAVGGIHYLVPVRNGKIGADVLFETEWLNVVRQTCEIQDGEIVLKDGAKDVHVIRQSV